MLVYYKANIKKNGISTTIYKIDDQQDLLYSTGNSTLYSVITSVGKNLKKNTWN